MSVDGACGVQRGEAASPAPGGAPTPSPGVGTPSAGPLTRFAVHPAVVAIAYLLGAVGLTWPLALDPAGQVAGGVRTDAFNSLWNLWFAHQGLARGEFTLHTTLLDPPDGGRIVVADPLNALLGYPLVTAFGEVTAYAVLVLGHLWLAGVAAHALGRRLGGHGWVAGIGFQWAPIVLSHVHNGSSEAVSAGLLPVALLASVNAMERGGAGRVVLAGIALFLAAFSGWYAGVGAFLVVTVILLVGWEGLSRRALLTRLLPAFALGLALTLPFAAAVKSVAQAEDGLVDIKNEDDLVRIRRTLGAADPRTFVAPLDFRSPDFANIEANPSDRVHTAYLGFVLVGLAATFGRRRALWIAAAGGVVVALGPVVVWDGMPLSVAGRALPLPYALIEEIPGFASLSLLYRVATVTALLVAVLADRARPFWAALVLAEVLLLSPVRSLPDVSRVPEAGPVAALRELPEGIVVNLPVLAGRNFLFEQTLHEQPVAGSLNSGMNKPGLKVLSAARKLRAGELDHAAFVGIARDNRIRYVVVHKNILMAESFVTAVTGIRRSFEPFAEDDDFAVYRLW